VSEAAAREVHVFADAGLLMLATAEIFVERAAAAATSTGRFAVALAGGSTPNALYQLLATDAFARRIDWPRVEFYWGDERCVPPEDAASNYRSAREHLLDRVPVAKGNLHRIEGERDPAEAAASYEHQLRARFASPSGPPRPAPGSRFDLVLLGLGVDGHTASLFPSTPGVGESERWVVAHHVAAVAMWRITLTPIVFNAAAEVLFLVTGGEKASTLRRVLEGPHQPTVLPAQAIAPQSGGLRWLVDADAARDLGTQ
jgi:6-phosphogluconolactonase